MMESSSSRAVTFIRVPSVAPERTDAYEKWYDNTHIPFRMSKPGFLGAQRYDMLVGRQRYFVFYELAEAAAAASKQYLALRDWERQQPADSFEAPGSSRPGFERGIYDQLAGPEWPAAELKAPFVHVAGYQPDASSVTSFQERLAATQLTDLQSIAGVTTVRLFVLATVDKGPGTGMHTPYPHLIAVSYLESDTVVDSSEFVAAQAAARKAEATPDREPYVVVGKLVHSAYGAALDTSS